LDLVHEIDAERFVFAKKCVISQDNNFLFSWNCLSSTAVHTAADRNTRFHVTHRRYVRMTLVIIKTLMPLHTQHQLIRVGTLTSWCEGSKSGTAGDMTLCCQRELIWKTRQWRTEAIGRPRGAALLGSGCHDATPRGFLLEQTVAHSKECKHKLEGEVSS